MVATFLISTFLNFFDVSEIYKIDKTVQKCPWDLHILFLTWNIIWSSEKKKSIEMRNFCKNRINFNDQWAFKFFVFLAKVKKNCFACKNTRIQLVFCRKRKIFCAEFFQCFFQFLYFFSFAYLSHKIYKSDFCWSLCQRIVYAAQWNFFANLINYFQKNFSSLLQIDWRLPIKRLRNLPELFDVAETEPTIVFFLASSLMEKL